MVVFKYPEEPKINYIKRCVGLPNETIEIRQGNVYRVTENGTEILRKDDPNKQRVLQLAVYNNDHPERPLIECRMARALGGGQEGPGTRMRSPAGRPTRTGWTADSEARSFHLTQERAGGNALRWIRYRNFVPKTSDWETLRRRAEAEYRRGPN